MPCHPDRVRRNYQGDVPEEIRRRYAAGERRIGVARDLFALYGDTLLSIEGIGEPSLMPSGELRYKDARVFVY